MSARKSVGGVLLIPLCFCKLKTIFSMILKVISYIGGVLFLVFAAVTLYEIVQ